MICGQATESDRKRREIDISVAGILSFVDALNKLEYRKKINGFRDRVEARV